MTGYEHTSEGLIVDGSFVPDDDIIQMDTQYETDGRFQVTVTVTPYMHRRVVDYLRSLDWRIIVQTPEPVRWW